MPRNSFAHASGTLALTLLFFGCSAGKPLGGGEASDAGGTSSGSGSGSSASGGSGAKASGGTHAGGSSNGGSSNGGSSSGGIGAGGASGSGAGQSGGSGPSGGTAGSPSGIGAPPSALATPSACTDGAPGPRKLWRLTAEQYAASIHSIFNDTNGAAPVGAVFSDPQILGFSIDASSLVVQGLNASQLMDSAEAVASWAASNGQLGQFASCTTVDATCAATFVKGFGRRAFRTTLADDDPRIATYSALFTAEKTFSDAAQAVMSAMLQSPYFLYRSELGTQSGSGYTLTPYEVASELSYLLTGNTPDDQLLSAADQVAGGNLDMVEMVDAQAARLIADGSPNNATAIMGFMKGWLGLDRLYTTAKDDTVFKLTQSLRDDMAEEAQSLIVEAFNQGGSLGSLFAADHTFLNKELADFYGFDSSGLGTSFQSVPVPPGAPRDSGLLATGAILNGYARPDASSPTQRGHLVRTRILCQDIGAPPSNLDVTLKPSTMAETTRQHMEREHSVGICYSCHGLMDWVGFGFEHYDAFGRWRDEDNGFPVDDSVTVYSDPEGNDVSLQGLSGPGSLGEYLAGSDDANRCMLRYWSYFAFGSSSWSQDACTYDSIYQEAQAGNFSLKTELMAIIHAANFTSRVKDQ